MSSKEFNVIAILYPKQGKTDEVLALLKDVSKYVHEKEPGVLRYSVNRVLRPAKDGSEEIVMIERYKDTQALKEHGGSERFAAFQKELADKGLMRAPSLLKMVSEQAGFTSRL